MDVLKAEKASKELDKFIDSQAKRKGEDAANLEGALERREDARKLAAMREENKSLWIRHYRRLAACNLAAARDYRARARALETEGETAA